MGEKKEGFWGKDVEDIALDELWSAYRQEVNKMEDAMYLQPVHHEIDQLLEEAADVGKEKLRQLGIEPADPDIYFIPSERGATTSEQGPVIVGRFGKTDREYNAVDIMAHEHFHHYVFHGNEVEQYRPREEAFAKILDLYHMGVIENVKEREAVLQEERELYNDSPGLAENFGDRLYKRATAFIDILEKDLDGPLQERMSQLTGQYIEHHMDLGASSI